MSSVSVGQTLPQFNAETALAALVEAAGQVQLDAADADLVRIGSNAVFRLQHTPIMGRVAPSGNRLASATREVAIARWLFDAGVPAVRALDIEQPLSVKGRIVTFWESASDKVEYGTTSELGALLRQLHALSPSVALPAHDPFGRAYGRLEAYQGGDHDFLLAQWERLREPYSKLVFELQPGVIHGDANVGNLIRDRSGRALLSDFDGFSIGPREWDLILTAIYYERYGWNTSAEYRALVDVYGFDVMAWSGYEVMADVRELLMVIWLADKSMSDETVRGELSTRVRALKTGASRLNWRPL